MKKRILLLLAAIVAIGAFTHKVTSSSGTGPWVVIDSGYQISITPASDTALTTVLSSLKAATKTTK
jgi:hypothetical protein